MGIDFATRGARVPSVGSIRGRAREKDDGLSMAQVTSVVRSFDTATETNGYQDLRAIYYIGGSYDDALDELQRGRYIVWAIDYGWINRHYKTKSGDPNFYGKHAVGAVGLRVRSGNRQTQVFDPLADARRKGIPQGPQWWDLSKLMQAGDAVQAFGRFTACVILPAQRLED